MLKNYFKTAWRNLVRKKYPGSFEEPGEEPEDGMMPLVRGRRVARGGTRPKQKVPTHF